MSDPKAPWTGACLYCPANFRTRAELEEHERDHRAPVVGLDISKIDHSCMIVGHVDAIGNFVIDEVATAEFRTNKAAIPSVSRSVRNV